MDEWTRVERKPAADDRGTLATTGGSALELTMAVFQGDGTGRPCVDWWRQSLTRRQTAGSKPSGLWAWLLALGSIKRDKGDPYSPCKRPLPFGSCGEGREGCSK